MALTIDATHEGPPPLLLLAWSEFAPVGITQLTERSVQLLMSFKTSACLRSTLSMSCRYALVQPGSCLNVVLTPFRAGAARSWFAKGRAHKPWNRLSGVRFS